MNTILTFVAVGVLVFGVALGSHLFSGPTSETVVPANEDPAMTPESKPEGEPRVQGFSDDGLRTDTSVTSIPLDEILDGGPGKDGIPAINDPVFVSVPEVTGQIDDEDLGMYVEIQGDQRFYPYDILYWHEIVNDRIGELPVAVTFCPLCGSAITFDRRVDGEVLEFGVSGKLWQSNLLMYDNKTESLWSQIRGEAMVGAMTGAELTVLESDILDFGTVRNAFPNAKVLSRDTGFNRDYDRSPYGNYEENTSIFFPVENRDARFHPKELFHIVNDGDMSVGFQRSLLIEQGQAEVMVNGTTYRAQVSPEGIITVTTDNGSSSLPGYTAMWFSWITHQDLEKYIWPEPDGE